jgi:hypothetical protein
VTRNSVVKRVITAGQFGCLVAALAFQAYINASEVGRTLITKPGGAIRDLVAAALGWDQHQRLHDTVAVWGPLVGLAALATIAAALMLKGRVLAPRLEDLVSLLAPWVVLYCIGSEFWRSVALWWLGGALTIWVYELKLHSPRRTNWALAVSIPAWLLLLPSVDPWIWPLGWATVTLGILWPVTVQRAD